MKLDLLFEKRSVALLMLIHRKKRIHSAELMMTGSNYCKARSRALELQDMGLIISSPDDSHKNQTNWELTPRGNATVLMMIMSTYVGEGHVDYRSVLRDDVVNGLENGDIDDMIHELLNGGRDE